MHVIIFIFFMAASLVQATEVDSFSARNEGMKDATEELNKLMNAHLKDTIDEANSWGLCDNGRFRRALHDRIGGVFWTSFEEQIGKNKSIDKRKFARADSVYQDVSFFYAPALFIADFGDVMHMGKYFIGGDKFGHFIEEGFNYYQIIHEDKKKLVDALAFGKRAEGGHFGLSTTGIFSWADLAANYQGYKEFWLPLIGAFDDSYVSCDKGNYQRRRPFNWGTHANAAWDEGINCSTYKNNAMTNAIEKRIKKLEAKTGQNLSCPIMPEACPSLIEYFGAVAPQVITKKCFKRP